MRRLAAHLATLLAAAALCSCTVVIGRRPPATATIAPSATPREVIYPTTAPTLPPTAAPTPTASPTPTPVPTASATAVPSPTPEPTAPPTPAAVIYVVQQGDTLSAIADSFDVTVEAIAEANALEDPSKLSIGQQLTIPLPPAAGTTAELAEVVATAQPAQAGPASEPTATAEPLATASATTEPPALATPIPSTDARVTEGTVTLNIVDIAAALTPLRPEEVGYPYDDLDLSKVGSPTPREYKALFLENRYIVVTVLPELGGRIYQILDKVTGRSLLYNNPAIVPTNWGMRGWWLAIGGIEWALPTEEHGLAEYLPWSATAATADGEASVTVSFTERLTGVECQVRIAIDATHAYVKIAPAFSNPGPSQQQMQFWVNAMYAPGGQSVPADTRLVFPTDKVVLHSSSDPGLPDPGQTMPWPVYGPRDLSLLSEWHGYFGAFAQPQAVAGYLGAQSPGYGGIMRSFPQATAIGIKFFGLGDIPYSRYSGVDSSYLELWGGWTASFWSYQPLAPGQAVQWQEYWYPLPEMPPVTMANEAAALSVTDSSCYVASTSGFNAEVEAQAADGTSLQRWYATLAPGEVWASGDLPSGTAAIEVRNRADGAVLLRWEA